MQQKSHEILSGKCPEDAGDGEADEPECDEGEERRARRLLAAAEEALAADWPRDHDLPVSGRAG